MVVRAPSGMKGGRNVRRMLHSVLFVLMLWGCCAAAESKDPDIVSVSAVGESLVEPDLARVVFLIRVEATNHEDARTRGSAHAEAVADVLNRYVEHKDIKTEQVRIQPLQEWRERHRNDKRPSRIVVGYEYSNSFAVSVRDLLRVSELADEVLKISPDGQISLGSVTYAVENKEDHELAARRDAIRKARNYASVLVDGAGHAALGRVISIHSSSNEMPSYSYARGFNPEMDMMASSADFGGEKVGAAPSVGIQGGGVEKISVSVSVTWEIQSTV